MVAIYMVVKVDNKNMQAFIIDKYGKSSGRITEIAEPQMQEDEVLIRVCAAGVNALDSKIRTGEFKLLLPYRLPLILGNDVSGVVVRTGSAVHAFRLGDEVYARPEQDRIGAFAQFIAVKESALALKPKNLDFLQAASVPLVSLTAWQALVDVAKLRKGQKIFIHAGSGGVGTIAIQLAKHLGAFVATTTSEKNVQWVKALGADVVVDYKAQSFETGDRDYDVVINSLGTDVLEKSLSILKTGGKLISISGPPTPEFATEQGLPWYLRQTMRLLSYRIRKKAKRQGVKYTFLFMRASGRQLSEITTLIESGIIHPVIDRVFPFEKTAEALDYVETGRAKGKVVIDMGIEENLNTDI